MKVLVDTDAFCKLGLAGLLTDAVTNLGAQIADCERLPALPHMLRRGSLPRRFGKETCESLLGTADSILPLQPFSSDWLERFLPVPGIDPGEAQLFAAAADRRLFVLSGDKRALRAVVNVEGAAQALSGLIVTLEAVLIALHDSVGVTTLRTRIAPLRPFDTTVGICFSDGNTDPLSAAWSYYNSLASEVAPLELWRPPSRTT
ncbi:MAG TPA: hypothetical protein VNJ02_13385 [Vicinamibacterales bacterium]|nr:hypothetical protein [Vicinamibacterales bacterium]